MAAPPLPYADAYDTRAPGGGSQFQLRRVDGRDADGRATISLLALGVGSLAVTLDGVMVRAGERVPVAIKQMSFLKSAVAAAVAAGEHRGVEALASRGHPSIVRCLSVFEADEGGGRVRLSFVFERCPTAVPFPIAATLSPKGFCVPADGASQPEALGCDLYSNPIKAPTTSPFSVREAAHVLKQVLAAVAHLHAATPPIVHRDVKPENLLIWRAERDAASGELLLEVKLTDYGTMRRLDKRDLTVGSGTRAFMAGEVDAPTGANAKTRVPTGSYDASVDVYSAGATFFFLVTGASPSGDTRKAWQLRLGGESTVTVDMSKKWYKAHPAAWAAAQGAGGGSVPPVTTLDYYFPEGSVQRELLQRLVSPSDRLSAADALAWMQAAGL